MFLPTRLPPLPLHLENFGQQDTTTVASATLSQSMQPFSHMVSQNMISNLTATGTSSQEQQMALLQGMNQSQLGVPNQQFPQQNPYPNRWFRMSLGDSQQSPLDPFALPVASTMPDAAASATIRQFRQQDPTTRDHGNQLPRSTSRGRSAPPPPNGSKGRIHCSSFDGWR